MPRFPTDFTSKTAPVGTDILMLADSAAGNSNKSSQINQILGSMSGPEGFAQNYQIVTSVATGNLTVSIKTLAGTDPSATNPVYVVIGGVVRTITSALSVTTSAGANIHNAGSAELATKEIDYFVYLAWSTVSNSVIIAQCRLPYVRVQSDADVATTTSERFLNRNASANATDAYVNIGRFNAILSAGAGYTWSIPATSVIINHPIYETRLLSLATVWTGFSVNPTATFTYKIIGSKVFLRETDAASGTSNATTFTFTAPFSALSTQTALAPAFVTDNSAIQTTPGHIASTAGSNVLTVGKTYYNGAWTAAGSKNVAFGEFSYEI